MGDTNLSVNVPNIINNENSLSPDSLDSKAANSKLTSMQIRNKFGQLGPSKGQFNSPHGFCLGNDEDIIVADTNNKSINFRYLTRLVFTNLALVRLEKKKVNYGIQEK